MGEARDELTSHADQIERRIEDARGRLTVRLSLLEQRTRDLVSLRQRVAQRPWAALGIAAGVGLALGFLTHGSRFSR